MAPDVNATGASLAVGCRQVTFEGIGSSFGFGQRSSEDKGPNIQFITELCVVRATVILGSKVGNNYAASKCRKWQCISCQSTFIRAL